jgi:hypothetical protein
MVKNTTGILTFLIIFLMGLAYGCQNRPTSPADQTRNYKIKVDNISVQQGVNHTDTLKIKFTGTTGATSCFSFSHFQGSNSHLRTYLTLWGEEQYGSNAVCNTVIIPLDETFHVYPISAGTHVITVYQPDGSLFEKEVIIE